MRQSSLKTTNLYKNETRLGKKETQRSILKNVTELFQFKNNKRVCSFN